MLCLRLCCCQSVTAVGGAAARPLVLALSNPTSKAEVSFSDALLWSGGKAVYASGSPFPSITISDLTATSRSSSSGGSIPSSDTESSSDSRAAPAGGTLHHSKVLVPGQANNCLIFPGLSLGVVNSGAVAVTDELLLAAAGAVAGDRITLVCRS
jgi:malate dehydrogenase (oxaloacetate-decarboxylating)(NADP+)